MYSFLKPHGKLLLPFRDQEEDTILASNYDIGNGTGLWTDIINSSGFSGSLLSEYWDEFLALPYIMRVIIGVNIMGWVLWQFCPYLMEQHTRSSLENIRSGRWWATLCSPISHQDWYHIALNMKFFSRFGPTVFNALGADAFMLTIITAACMSGTLPLAIESFLMRSFKNDKRHQSRTFNAHFGFSGINSTILYLFAALQPNAIVIPNIYDDGDAGITVKSFAKASFWIDLSGLLVESFLFSTRISHSGHLAGFLCGFLLRKFFCRTVMGRRLLRKRSRRHFCTTKFDIL